jgi:hypothetical protein
MLDNVLEEIQPPVGITWIIGWVQDLVRRASRIADNY